MFAILCLHIKLPHYHHYADLSGIHWTSNRLARYILPRVVCLRLNQFFQLSFTQYMGLCVFGLHISLRMIREYGYFILVSSSNRKHDIFAILGLCNETWYALYVFLYFNDWLCLFILLLQRSKLKSIMRPDVLNSRQSVNHKISIKWFTNGRIIISKISKHTTINQKDLLQC